MLGLLGGSHPPFTRLFPKLADAGDPRRRLRRIGGPTLDRGLAQAPDDEDLVVVHVDGGWLGEPSPRYVLHDPPPDVLGLCSL
ncbi:MAG: hypothetical protein E6G01_04775 [Actinobacteria bacterium]|nr:MAG: hypothetical protein E6G01_04775 [Actinomycetota bacterium]